MLLQKLDNCILVHVGQWDSFCPPGKLVHSCQDILMLCCFEKLGLISPMISSPPCSKDASIVTGCKGIAYFLFISSTDTSYKLDISYRAYVHLFKVWANNNQLVGSYEL